MRKVVSEIILALLAINMLSIAFNIQPAKAEWTGTVYIRADGSIDPPDAPITTYDNITYTLTDNITSSGNGIVVERDNIVIDGAGYTLQQTEGYLYIGIDLFGRENVTVSNIQIKAFGSGIRLWGSSNNSIVGNNITNNYNDGIYLKSSNNNSIVGNNITNNYNDGILLVKSSNNSIVGNTFIDDGLYVLGSYQNVVESNTVNSKPLVYLEDVSDYVVGDAGQVILVRCNRIRVENLNLSKTDIGVQLFETNNTIISRNNITANDFVGILLVKSSNNSIVGNNITNNWCGIMLYSSSNNDFYHNNFINNAQHVCMYESGYANVWDDGYPSGGNYWSDYKDRYPDVEDVYNGSYQNETGSDGIWDHPYVIDENNQDRYPLVNPWTPIPPAPDFSISASPDSFTIQQGSSATSVITVTSIGFFNQPIQLSVSSVPSGVTATLNPEEVTPPAGGTATSTLTVSADTTATPGSYTLTVTGTNGTTTHSVDITLEITQVGEWSFAIITDIHIGWGYADYGDIGYDDANLEAAQDYWLTERLNKVVEKIIQIKNTHNIKFVVVLGDIADTAEKSEFLKAREILSRLNDPNGDGDISDGIPYIPIIGNHDIWPYTMTQGIDPDKRDEKYVATAVDKTSYNPDRLGDRFFQKIFWEDQESKNNRDLITRVFGSSWERQNHNSAPYLQNYKFRFGDMNFVCLDFNPRDPSMAYPGSKLGAHAALFNDTTTWLNDFLNENEGRKVIVLCHHPLSFLGGFIAPSEYVNYFKNLIENKRIILYDFGGHTHVNDVSSSALAPYVVETEAVFQESAKIIRIVKVDGQQINYNTFEGVADSDPGLSLFFKFSPGNPSNNQDIHFVARTVDFAEDRSNWRFSKELNSACLSCYYDWSFGDGESLQGWGNPIPKKFGADDPTHSYNYAGAYRLNLIVNTPEGTISLNGYPIFISGELSPIHYICGLPENFQAVSTGRGVSVTEGGDGQNTFEMVLISKTASPETPIVEFGVHFENATEDIDLSTFVADVDITERKSFFYMPTWPDVIEETKTLYIPSTGVGAVYLCFNATSLHEVNLENADMVIHVGETKNGITVTTTYFNGTEYYAVHGVTGTGGGEAQTYALTITTTTGGTTNPAPGTYNYTANSTVQVTAIPEANYKFEYWELDGINVGSANPYSVLMDKNHTLTAVFSPLPPPLSASISPLSASILVGQPVTFTSTVSGGYPPYSYQWYLNDNPVSGATADTWTFTPSESGIFYVYLKVTDDEGNTAQSETARITVAAVPVGGYSIPIQAPATAKPLTPYLILTAILTITFTTIKRKTTKKTKKHHQISP